MPQIITKTVYSFAELKELAEAKGATKQQKRAYEKAQDKLQSWATDWSEWSECTLDEYKEALESVGFTDPEIRFSGFCSQGDGASFLSGVDVAKMIDFLSKPLQPTEGIGMTLDGKSAFGPWLVHQCEGIRFNPKFSRLNWAINELSLTVSGNGRGNYCHEYTAKVEDEVYHLGSDTPRLTALWAEFVEVVEEFRKDLCRAIYKSLNADYDYCMSDENLLEMADNNAYQFDDSGDME